MYTFDSQAPDDHFEVVTYLKHLESSHLVQLGGELGLNYSNLKRMDGSQDMADQVVHAWLLRQDKVLVTSGIPTYESLAIALGKMDKME